MRLYAEIDGRLADLTTVDEATAAEALSRAAAVFVAHPDHRETVAHYPSRGRWTRGGRPVAEADLPDGWELPNGRRLARPGGRENPHIPAKSGKPEVKAQWRLSTPRT